MFLYKDKKFSQATIEARQYVDQFVEKATKYRATIEAAGSSNDSPPRYVFLHELSKQTQDRKVLTDQLLNILLAGRDTTASLLTITFFILARTPDVWTKLRAEVLNLEGRRPSFEDLKSMKYLTWVINESKLPKFDPIANVRLGSGAMLKLISIEAISPCACQLTYSQQGHISSAWWWSRRQRPSFRSQGTEGLIQHILYAPSS